MTYIVGAPGFEPGAPCSQSRCANRTAPCPDTFYKEWFYYKTGRGGGIRTRGTCFQVRRFSKPVDSATLPLLRVILFLIQVHFLSNAVQIYI